MVKKIENIIVFINFGFNKIKKHLCKSFEFSDYYGFSYYNFDKNFNLFISKTYLTGVKIRIVAHWAQLSLPTFKTYCQSYIGTYKEFF